VAAPLLLIVLMTGAVQAQTPPPPDTSDDDGPPPFANTTQTAPPGTSPTTDPQTGVMAPVTDAEPPVADPIHHPVVRPFEMPKAYQPAAPLAYDALPSATPKTAVAVEKYRGDYEGPADEQQRYYLAGVAGHFETEQAMMGALDGEWTVTANNAPLFTMILNDGGEGQAVEGAWRDLRAGHPSNMGVIDSVDHGDLIKLKISFHSGDGDRLEPTVLTLTRQPDGRWSGEMNDAGAVQPVVMNHAPVVPAQP
jgi:hypothetical protein